MSSTGYYRKIIRITAEDSPNVRLGLGLAALGREDEIEVVVPGVLPYHEYVKRRATWDPVRQCIGLDAQFWQGQEVLLYPPDWLDRAERAAYALRGRPRVAGAMGVDPGQGGANTALAVVDDLGLIKLRSKPTPDTTEILDLILEYMHEYNLPAEQVYIDTGGGGFQRADDLRKMGYMVNTVAFGEPATPPPKLGESRYRNKIMMKESKNAYSNRRAEMYGILRELLDPVREVAFALPAEYSRLRQQLAPIPLMYDQNRRLTLPPKYRRTARGKKIKSLEEIIGYSPDEADALVLAVYGLVGAGPTTVEYGII